MARPYQRLVKNVRFLPCIFALLFALVGLSTATPNTHAANAAVAPQIATSQNWSGFEAKGKLGTFKKAQMSFTVPTVRTQGDMSVWVGTGGDPNQVNPNNPVAGEQTAVLVQAGVDSCLGNPCSAPCRPSNVQCNYAWWEIADALVVQPIRFRQPISAGDLIVVYLESNLNNSSIDKFIIKDVNTNEIHTIIISDQGATKDNQRIPIIGGSNGLNIVTDGASVECIVERPAISIQPLVLTPLPTFGGAAVPHCDMGKGPGWQGIGAAPQLSQIFMIDDPTGKGGNSTRQRGSRSGSTNAPSLRAKASFLSGKFGDSFIVTPAAGTLAPITNSTVHSINLSGRASKRPPG